MTFDDAAVPSAPAPGWYPDPYGYRGLRWWDGTRWGDQWAPAPSAYTAQRRRPLDPATPIYTVWIWLVAAMPFGAYTGAAGLAAKLVIVWLARPIDTLRVACGAAL